MADFRAKFDSELRNILSSYETFRANPNAKLHPALARGNSVSVLMRYQGNLAAIEALGFNVTWDAGDGLARGTVDIAAIAQVANHPDVLRMEYGSRMKPMLDESVPAIHARPRISGDDHVWDVTSDGQFSGATGQGVIIGIIDSGIDFHHPVFLRSESPKKTRILRIWDPGLVPGPNEHSPDQDLINDPALLGARPPKPSYGVEYKDTDIENDIAAPVPVLVTVRHRDCGGHGTHVASIAAGDGRANDAKFGGKYRFIGVAPQAELVIVKYFDLETEPTASYAERFEDAITYIRRVAKQLNKPYVINFSAGDDTGPHDGRTLREAFLDRIFNNETGGAFVAAGGNSAGSNQHAEIQIPPGGEINVDLTLTDGRTEKSDWDYCESRDNTQELDVSFWYENVAGVKFSVKLANEDTFAAENIAVGGDKDELSGPKRFRLKHEAEVGDGGVTRNNAVLSVRADGNRHREGNYVVRINGPSGTFIHVWCNQTHRQDFTVSATPPWVTPTDVSTIGAPAGALRVISVANLNLASGGLSGSSSEGPLADYTGAGPTATKPNITAPGTRIYAAVSSFRCSLALAARFLFKDEYGFKSGTSMAAPHVAGVVALLLGADATLKSNDITRILEEEADPAGATDKWGAGVVNAFKAFKRVSP